MLRSDFSTEPSTTSRFGSLSSSSTYRPSFSSGSYRSPRSTTTSTASATAPSSTVSSFISRYSSLAADKEKERERDKAKEEERRKERELREREREKERDREKERLIETSKKLEAELKESKPAPLKKSSLIAAKYGSSKDATGTDDSSTKSGAAGKLQSTKDSGVKPKKDNAPPVTFTTRYGRAGVAREQSREPSPATRTNSSTSIASRSRHRDPSPAPTTVTEKARSRDPSPAVETKRTGGYALAIASKLSGTKLPQQNAPNEYRRQSSGTAFGQSRARSRDPSPTVRTRTSREPSPMEQRRIQLANKMIATAARSRDPSPAPVQQLKQTTNKSNSSADAKQRFTSSITIKTGPGVRSRDPSPAEARKIPTFGNASKVRSRDPSPADPKRTTSSLGTRASRTANDSGLVKPSTFGSARKTRDPSPSVGSKVRSRDPSPATVPRRSSREPSPAESVREKYGLGGPGAYRPYGRSNSALGAGNRFGASASPVPKSPIADLALSYMTSSEAIAARTSRPSSRLRLNSQSREPSQCSSPLTASQIFSPEPRPVPSDEQQREGSTSSETTTASSSSEESSEETESSVEPEPKIFIEITLVTRGTSPTPPGATPLIRARRAEMCKTIEKTIQKQLLPVETADKQIQSDRLDDSTKYLRYGQPSTRSWSPFLDQKYGSSSPTLGYTRYSSASSRYSRDSPSFSRETSVSSSKSDVPEKRELSALAARVKELSLSKSNSTKSTGSRSSTVSSPGGKQKTPPKQKSPEKPPPAPAKDSPSPVRSVANKDFRKSALNMGPAPDRPRKTSTSSSKSSSSSASTATPVAETNGSTSRIPHVRQQNGTKGTKRSDRSASSSSEDTASISGSSGTDTDREQSITRTAPNEQDDLSTATDASNANNELLLRAIQLATNFVNNQNRNATSWYDNASTTSMTESLAADPSGKSGWEAGTHYMESIKDDSSNEEDEGDEVDEQGPGTEGDESGQKPSSEYQQPMWWRRSGNYEQTATVQETAPSARSFTYRIRRVESGEKPWWLADEGNKPVPDLEPDSTEPCSTAGQDVTGGAEAAIDDGRTTATSIFESQTLSPFRPIRVTRIESGERAWWMKSTENVASKSSGERSKQPSKEQTPDSAGGGKKSPGYTVFKLEAEDEAWWEQAMADLSRKEQTSGSSPSSTSGSREPSKEPTPEPRGQGVTLTRVVSGEKAWWLYSSEKVNELGQSPATDGAGSGNGAEGSDSVRECSPVKAKPFKITRIESGERPWWMLETSDAPVSRSGSKSNVVSRSNSFNSKASGKQTSPTKYRITRIESGERAWWMTGDSPDEGAGSPRKLSSFVEQHGEEEADLQNVDIEAQVEQELESITNFVAGLPKFPTGEYTIEPLTSETPPLGDRASPEGEAGGRASPYDNIPSTMSVPLQVSGQSGASASAENGTHGSTDLGSLGARKNTQSPVFISRHTNIDDLLGGSCHPLSPMMDRMFIMDGLQEITPKDVRVHDSTPQFIDYAGQQRQRKSSTI
ncbi:serine/arginine repetitive matrix protein 2-like [Anopheles marshallii]|uniref:serine/arginine repetitive matrix protein 2-like n=1 Tax=Anopheles marshallii TaxID=1521116 RepID=UPI00237AEB24|nr:serine/arginine repetitive matrix protein 2-like [Anopheles marshallii]